MSRLHVVVPDTVDDPGRPSGGNVYDRQVCHELRSGGWRVDWHAVAGTWPAPDEAARHGLSRVLAEVPDGELVLLDGLVACCLPDVVVPAARRLRLVVLVHMPLGGEEDGAGARSRDEQAVLSAAAAVVTTSAWTRGWLLARYGLRPSRVAVAVPGVEGAAVASGTSTGQELLCVAALTPHKGHDQLIAALAELQDLTWRCTCAGALDLDPTWVQRLQQQAKEAGVADRVRFVGPVTGPDLDGLYAASDLLVLASRAETYGLVVTEALARGLPVVATAVGGVPEALGWVREDVRPGWLVPPGDSGALAAALRSWLADAGIRQELRGLARDRRGALEPWSATAGRLADVLRSAAR